MFSSAYPDIKLNYSSVSPCLTGDMNDYLLTFNSLHKLLLEVFEKVSTIYNMAATDLLSFIDTSNKKLLEVTKGATKSCTSSLVLFLNNCLAEVEKQALSLRSFQASLQNSVVKPLRHVVRQKKEMWKTCFRYADSFHQQICKQEAALQKCYKHYSEAAVKVKPGNTMERQFQIFHDSHNTYVLKWTSVNSIHNVFYTHVLPHIMHTIESNHDELNNNYRHHLSNMLYLQNNTWSKIIKSGDQMQSALENLNFLQDLQSFIKLSNEKVKDKHVSMLPSFSLPKVEQPKVGMLNNLDSMFIISERTRPNLQRRLASLQQQTQQLVHDISAMRESEESNGSQVQQCESKTLNKLMSYLNICDKEANLNVLLKQMELYTPTVVNFLGPMPENLLLESKHSKKSTEDTNLIIPFSEGTRPHEFTEPRVMKPISCFYCEKMIAIIGKGYICKVCKVSVHKKCATSVKFCEPLLLIHKIPTAPPESISGSLKSIPDTMRTTFVSDLIFLESDDEFEDAHSEFNDGFSEESDNGSEGTREIPSLYPSIPDSLTLPVSPCNVRHSSVLPDILNFSPQPIYDSVDNNVCVTEEKNNKYNSDNLMLLNSLYDEVQSEESAKTTKTESPITHHPRGFPKPFVGKKPSLPTLSAVNVTEEKNKYSSDNLISLNLLYDEVQSEKTTQLDSPIIPPRNLFKPPVAKKPVLTNSPGSTKSPVAAKLSNHVTSPVSVRNNSYVHGDQSPINATKPLLDKTTVSDAKPFETLGSSTHENTCVSLYDYHGTDSTHLSFYSGEKVGLLEKTNEEWWHGELNGNTGYFPSQYVLEMNTNEKVMRALYDFSKESEVELNMLEDDIVLFMHEENEWVMVRGKDGEGLVPASYVDLV